MPTIRDVARAAGVSTATVSAVLNDTAFVSPALRQRVEAAVAKLGYAPHSIARSLKRGRTQLLGLMIPDITNPFFTELVHVVEVAAHRAGYGVLLCDSGQDPAKERSYLQLMRSHRVDGLVLCPVGDGGLAEPARAGGMPLVMVDRLVPGLEADVVLMDNYAAGLAATRHLVNLGHRRIGAVAGPAGLEPADERLRGFREALALRGLAVRDGDIRHGNFEEEGAYLASLELLGGTSRPTALFVANNHMLIGVMRAVANLAMSCPADISVAAVDDFPWANAFTPRLTTVRQPVAAMGETALRLLLERLAGGDGPPRRIVLPAELVIRDSVRQLNPAEVHRLGPARTASP
ncbi:MAG: LacI family DNA-binding transcriptional regulator [Geminicoccaceae bacterium]